VDTNHNGRFDPGTDTLEDVEEVAAGTVPPNLQAYIVTSGGNSYLYRTRCWDSATA
jgi:hypothetical protein